MLAFSKVGSYKLQLVNRKDEERKTETLTKER